MRSRVVAREEQVEDINKVISSDQAELLALYGRRRVGKTFLVRKTCENKKGTVYLNITGTKDGSKSEQIQHFLEQFGEVFLDGIIPQTVNSWDEAFKLLNNAIKKIEKNKKVVIFLDELPWLATPKSKLLQAIDYYWNQHWSWNPAVKLIVCGSSASWIIRKIIKNKGGLHNRVTKEIHLKPFNLKQTKTFLKYLGLKLNNKQILKIYLVTGGIPFYLMFLEKGLSADQLIEKIAFREKAPLLTEFDKLFSSLFKNHESYVEILRHLARHPTGISRAELLDKVGESLNGQGGTKKLNALQESDFIIEFKPHFNSKKGVYYKLIDEYTLFYFRWIEPIRQTLQAFSLDEGNWIEAQSSAEWRAWSGLAFEAVCYKHISQIRKALDISPTAVANSWRYVPSKGKDDQGAQVDLLFDRKDGVISLCEIKYTEKPFVIDKQYARNLLNKQKVFLSRTKTKKQLFISLIASGGAKDNLYFEDFIDSMVVFDDLFK